MKRNWFLLMSMLIILTVLSACGSNGSANTEADNPSGNTAAAGAGLDTESKELTVYTALEDDQIKEYLKSFNEKYPDIKLNIVRDSTGIITAKLLAEKDNPQADVVWGVAATSLLVLDQNGMLEPYSPVGIDRIQDDFKDSSSPAHWVGIDAWETAITANTVELEKKGLAVPQSYEDLIKPEYKGLITMPNPASSGTGFLTVSGLQQLLGADQAWEYLDKLHENIGIYTHSGSKPAKMAGTGEYPIGISFGYRGIKEKNDGSPVEVVFPAEGSGWDVEANALMKKATIKKAAKDFLDWAITDEAMAEYSKNYPIVAVKGDSGVIPDGYTKNPVEQLIEYDLQEAAKDRDNVLNEWSARYDSKSEPKS
ncbi:putative 2-aminoethylphosphonate ABC transporter substrate-binding protein [Paenibacillus alkaliterrae]|uniref:putative 2-aminoethylphosphonate ABC transporter substrate-binding protein n=1 Tax=Paenibacillus alkaliterrae TaxID=320909 RepID=UPI001F29C244|nr:putative 2-aminoethylphosphonate ABC transporter substrate-binding protein [Paenibacillus alkaliterrae]MCF2938976.1 putative 2-aminoethylphosphonate ABC transporter substrate-binding protein [Paenibacillus alkaliterrae]